MRRLARRVAELAADRELELGVARHRAREREQLRLDPGLGSGATARWRGCRPARCRRAADRSSTSATRPCRRAARPRCRSRAGEDAARSAPTSRLVSTDGSARTARNCAELVDRAAGREQLLTGRARHAGVAGKSCRRGGERALEIAEPTTCPPSPSWSASRSARKRSTIAVDFLSSFSASPMTLEARSSASAPTSVRSEATAAVRSASICACAFAAMRAASAAPAHLSSARISAPSVAGLFADATGLGAGLGQLRVVLIQRLLRTGLRLFGPLDATLDRIGDGRRARR